MRDFLTELQPEDYEMITSETISRTCIPTTWRTGSVIQPRITRVPLKECYPYPSGKKFIYFEWLAGTPYAIRRALNTVGLPAHPYNP
jgi:hypothetical protein